MMRKTWAPALAVALVVLMAVPATAAKPDKPPKQPQPHPDGLTCLETGWGAVVEPSDDGFIVTVDGGGETACVDVPAAPGETWGVEVTVGSARGVWVMVKDSQPGDFCWGAEVTESQASYAAYLEPGNGEGACFGDVYTDSDPAQLVFAVMTRGKKSLDPPVTVQVTLP